MITNLYGKLIAFLERKIPYTMEHSRENAIMIIA
jgi:hypothetical protein